jgi:anti-sigma factor RsiW
VMVCAHDGSDAETTEDYVRRGYNLVHTSADNLDYWVVSDLNRVELADFVSQLMIAARAPDAQT